MSFFHKKKSPAAKTVAVFEISSRGVGASVIMFLQGKRPRVFWRGRTDIPLEHSGPELEGALKKSLRNLAIAALQHPMPIQEVFCFIGEPYVRGEFRVVTLEKKTDFTVTKKILDDMLAEDFKELEREISIKFHTHEAMSLLDRKTNWVAVNGHRIAEYIGKTVSRIDIGTYWSVAPRHIVESARRTLSSVFKRQTITCHSLAYAELSAAQILSPHASFALLSIGGDSSDLSIVTGEGLCSTLSIPSGTRALLEAVGKTFGLTREREIMSLLRMFDSKVISEKEESRIRLSLEKASRMWLRAIEAAWADAFAIGHVPGICFYQGESELAPIFKKSIAESSYLKTHAPSGWKLIPFEKILPGHVLFEDGNAEGATAALALFIKHAQNEE